MELHSRFFFITCNIRRDVRPFCDEELDTLAEIFTSVRRNVNVALCGYCLMPDHWHAILFPSESATISDIMLRIKTAFTQRIRKARPGTPPVWQARYYDHILYTRGEFDDTLAYLHENPVRRGLVDNSLDWKWSSGQWFVDGTGPVQVDEARLPLNPSDRI